MSTSTTGKTQAIVKRKGNGWGGRRQGAGPPGNQHALTHGARSLEELLKRGVDPETPIGRLLHERRQLYVSDLGGPEAISHMEGGLCDRLAKLDLFECLLDARMTDPQTGKTRRLSWARLHSLGLLRVRLTDSFTRTASALGIRRREKPVPSLAEYLNTTDFSTSAEPGEPPMSGDGA